uniref:Adenosine diphosphatase n=1 Tax=Solanum tuberosum TaxID=4113 RepID=M1CLA5_SOLTU
MRSSRDWDLLLWRRCWLLCGDQKEPVVLLSYCICPKLPDEKLCATLLDDEYKEDSASWIPLPPKQCTVSNGLC